MPPTDDPILRNAVPPGVRAASPGLIDDLTILEYPQESYASLALRWPYEPDYLRRLHGSMWAAGLAPRAAHSSASTSNAAERNG